MIADEMISTATNILATGTRGALTLSVSGDTASISDGAGFNVTVKQDGNNLWRVGDKRFAFFTSAILWAIKLYKGVK